MFLVVNSNGVFLTIVVRACVRCVCDFRDRIHGKDACVRACWLCGRFDRCLPDKKIGRRKGEAW